MKGASLASDLEETGARLWRAEKRDIRGRKNSGNSRGEAERNLIGPWKVAEFGQAAWRSKVTSMTVEVGWGQGLESPGRGVIGIVP